MRKRILFWVVGMLVLIGGVGQLYAQPLGLNKAVSRCEAYANSQWRTSQPEPISPVIFVESESALSPVESALGEASLLVIVTGGAILKRDGGQSEDVRYTCLLSQAEEVVLFHVQPHSFPNFMAFCAAEAKMAYEIADCLKARYQAEEAERVTREAAVRVAAQAYDAERSPKTRLADLLEESEADWRAYREHICQARLEALAGANHPDIPYYDCLLIHTRERIHALHHYPPSP